MLSPSILWPQFGAAIDMLDNAIGGCPDILWNDKSRGAEFWYVAYHALFWCDLYIAGTLEGFAPPAPFTLDELDPAGVRPARPWTKEELRAYAQHCRDAARTKIESLTEEGAARIVPFDWIPVSYGELILYNLRHIQHHTGQLNLLCRQCIGSAPQWVKQAG